MTAGLTFITCSMIGWVHFVIIVFNLIFIAMLRNFTKEETEAEEVRQHSLCHTALAGLEFKSQCLYAVWSPPGSRGASHCFLNVTEHLIGRKCYFIF